MEIQLVENESSESDGLVLESKNTIDEPANKHDDEALRYDLNPTKENFVQLILSTAPMNLR